MRWAMRKEKWIQHWITLSTSINETILRWIIPRMMWISASSCFWSYPWADAAGSRFHTCFDCAAFLAHSADKILIATGAGAVSFSKGETLSCGWGTEKLSWWLGVREEIVKPFTTIENPPCPIISPSEVKLLREKGWRFMVGRATKKDNALCLTDDQNVCRESWAPCKHQTHQLPQLPFEVHLNQERAVLKSSIPWTQSKFAPWGKQRINQVDLPLYLSVWSFLPLFMIRRPCTRDSRKRAYL